MPKRDWLRYSPFALAFLLICGLGGLAYWDLSQYQARETAEAQAHTPDQQRIANGKIAIECASLELIQRLICESEKAGAYREAERSEKDLQAQQNMVKVAFWMAVLTWVQALVGVAGVVYVARALRQAIKANEGAQKAIDAERDLRQIEVGAHIILSMVRINLGTDLSPLNFRYGNDGQTVARRLNFLIKIGVTGKDTPFSPSFNLPEYFLVGDVARNDYDDWHGHIKDFEFTGEMITAAGMDGFAIHAHIVATFFDVFGHRRNEVFMFWKRFKKGEGPGAGGHQMEPTPTKESH